MSEHPIADPDPRTQRHLTLVESEPSHEEHEVSLGLVFFDITDASMTDEEIATHAQHLTADTLNPASLRGIDSSEYPKVIARQVLEETHIQSDYDALREHANEEGGKLSDLERQELAHALEIERRFNQATGLIETAADARQTHDLVEIVEQHVEDNDYYKTNVLRLCMALQTNAELARYRPSIIVAGRIIKAMLLVSAEETKPTSQP